MAAFALALSANAAELVITHGGRRIIDPDPTRSDTNCVGWSYDPAPVALENDITHVYSTSDVLTNHCAETLPFADRIWHHQRGANGVWSAVPVIGRTSFRWMFGDFPIDPQAYVGRVASPTVVKSKGRYFMAFVASVADPYLCSGDHTSTAACGLCSDPWSHFAVYWATSLDGATWHILPKSNPVDNIALSTALLYREPSANDKLTGSQYRGITRVRALLADGYIYLLSQFSATDGARSMLLRAPFDGSTEFGITGDFEAWRGDQGSWQAVTASRIPDEFDTGGSATGYAPAITSFADITHIEGFRFIGLIPTSGRTNRVNTRLDYVLSNDLLSWTPAKPLRSAIHFFADDGSYSNSVVDPILVEDAQGAMHFFMASNDGDDDHGIARDGVPDCFGVGAAASKVGLGIYEAFVEIAPLSPTTTTITARTNPAAAGNVTFDIRVTSPTGQTPSGQLTFTAGSSTQLVDVNNGRATVTVPLNVPGSYPVHAFFSSVGPWESSNADAVQTVIQAAVARKRAVRH
jgi:hypothetical protein